MVASAVIQILAWWWYCIVVLYSCENITCVATSNWYDGGRACGILEMFENMMACRTIPVAIASKRLSVPQVSVCIPSGLPAEKGSSRMFEVCRFLDEIQPWERLTTAGPSPKQRYRRKLFRETLSSVAAYVFHVAKVEFLFGAQKSSLSGY